MKKLTALVLALLMLVCFTACGESGNGGNGGDKAASIVGTWETEFDMGDMMGSLMGSMDMSGMEEYLKFDGVVLEMTMEIDDDTQKVYVTDEALDVFIDDVMVAFKDGMGEYMADMGVDLDEQLAASGMTEDEFWETAGLTKEAFATQFDKEALSVEYVYKMDGNKLYSSETKDGLDKAIDNDQYIEMELTADSLTWVSVSDAESEAAGDFNGMEINDLLPLKWTRV